MESFSKENCNDFRSFAKVLDIELWKQSEDKVNEIKNRSKEILSNLEISIGGGGIYPLLYFLTKKFKKGRLFCSFFLFSIKSINV